MLELKKDIEVKPRVTGQSYTIYKKGESVLGPIYNQLMPANKSTHLQIGVYDEEGNQVATLQTGQLHIANNVIYTNGEQKEAGDLFDNLFPEITKKGLDAIKALTFNDGILGDYLK